MFQGWQRKAFSRMTLPDFVRFVISRVEGLFCRQSQRDKSFISTERVYSPLSQNQFFVPKVGKPPTFFTRKRVLWHCLQILVRPTETHRRPHQMHLRPTEPHRRPPTKQTDKGNPPLPTSTLQGRLRSGKENHLTTSYPIM